MDLQILTTTRTGLPVLSYRWKNGNNRVLILGAVHGDEIEGVWCAQMLLQSFLQNFSLHLDLTLVPQMNPEGVFLRERRNAVGVDLNRNLPTKDWSPEVSTPRYNPGPAAGSEPESRALVGLIDQFSPQFILTLHSWHPLLNTNGDCERFAKKMQEHTGYRIDADIGYPTPGCLGTYAGIERNIPTLTFEIERGLSIEKIREIHFPAIVDSLKVLEN